MSAHSRLSERMESDSQTSGTIEILRSEARALVAEVNELHDIILALGEHATPFDPDGKSPRNVLHYVIDVLTDSCGFERAIRWLTQPHPVFFDRQAPLSIFRDRPDESQLTALAAMARRFAGEFDERKQRSK